MKLEFYDYVIGIELNDANYLDVCKHYLSVFKTPKIEDYDLTYEVINKASLLLAQTSNN